MSAKCYKGGKIVTVMGKVTVTPLQSYITNYFLW